MKAKITQEKLKEIISYNRYTGEFTWAKARPKVIVGEVAGSLDALGYRIITTPFGKFWASHLAIFYITGKMPNPKYDVDHINQINDDNHYLNLREITHVKNLQNSKLSKRNTSGIRGVSWYKASKAWQARICINFQEIHLGYYDSKDEAICARLAGEQCLDWTSWKVNSPAFDYVQRLIGKKIRTKKWYKLKNKEVAFESKDILRR